MLRGLFQVEVFRFLRERDLLTTERMELIQSWRHSGFDVYVGEPIAAEDWETLGHVARYLLRAPISLERLWYDPQAEKITLRPLTGEGAEPVELDPLEFIARLVQHIPDVRERQVICASGRSGPSSHDRIQEHVSGSEEWTMSWSDHTTTPTWGQNDAREGSEGARRGQEGQKEFVKEFVYRRPAQFESPTPQRPCSTPPTM